VRLVSQDPQASGREDQPDSPVRRAGRGQLLSAAEEVTLAKQIERGDLQAKEQMVESNLRLVFVLARRHRDRGVPFADLVQEGTIGLVRAVDRFDYRRGVKFSTYAAWWIQRSLRDAVASGQVIRIPVRAAHQLASVRRAEAELERLGAGRASTAAVVERTGLSGETVRALRSSARVAASLDEPVGEDGAPLGELVADESVADATERLIAGEQSRMVWSILRLLPKRHRAVLVRRYGLGGEPPQGHQRIGAWLGIGEERSRQLEREALHRLRTVATPLAA
jgi:RNA polymerase primary sigma factor